MSEALVLQLIPALPLCLTHNARCDTTGKA